MGFRDGLRNLRWKSGSKYVLMGMLVVNLVDSGTGAMVWRGMASGDVDENASPKKHDKKIHELSRRSSAATRLRNRDESKNFIQGTIGVPPQIGVVQFSLGRAMTREDRSARSQLRKPIGKANAAQHCGCDVHGLADANERVAPHFSTCGSLKQPTM